MPGKRGWPFATLAPSIDNLINSRHYCEGRRLWQLEEEGGGLTRYHSSQRSKFPLRFNHQKKSRCSLLRFCRLPTLVVHNRRHLPHHRGFRFPSPLRGWIWGPGKGDQLPFCPLMIISSPLLLGTKKRWGRWGGLRPLTSNGRIPIGQKKSVFRSVASRNLRASVSLGGGGGGGEEEVEVELDGIEVDEEEDKGEETGEEEEAGAEPEELEDENISYSSSSKIIEERSIRGRAAFFKVPKKEQISQTSEVLYCTMRKSRRLYLFCPNRHYCFEKWWIGGDFFKKKLWFVVQNREMEIIFRIFIAFFAMITYFLGKKICKRAWKAEVFFFLFLFLWWWWWWWWLCWGWWLNSNKIVLGIAVFLKLSGGEGGESYLLSPKWLVRSTEKNRNSI